MPDFSNERTVSQRGIPLAVAPLIPEPPTEIGRRKGREIDELTRDATRRRLQSEAAAEWWAKHNLMIGRQLPAK